AWARRDPGGLFLCLSCRRSGRMSPRAVSPRTVGGRARHLPVRMGGHRHRKAWLFAADGGGKRDLRAFHGVLEAHLASAICYAHGVVRSSFHRTPAQFIGAHPVEVRHFPQAHGGERGLPEPGSRGALGRERRCAVLG
ncbi:MAG: hypothetical protein ACK559_28485, partial [bacterium]